MDDFQSRALNEPVGSGANAVKTIVECRQVVANIEYTIGKQLE